MSLYPVFTDWAKKHGLDAAVARFAPALPDEVEKFRTQFELDREKIATGGPPIIAAGRDNWYPGPGEDDHYWPALRRDLERAGKLNQDVIEKLNDASNVVAHTPHPVPKRWLSRGLVVGYVQSGKTTNFTSVIAKMADEDYRLIIVLPGIHNGLRKQTQLRLDQQLKELNPDRWMTLTEESHDFHTPTYEPAMALTSSKVVLAIVKKNATVLTRLAKWLERDNGRQELRNTRVLIIDDEADQASVATARINPLIMRLMKLMPRSRGLTLEGLVSSFFVRGATAYDTLLQMGRWFGFWNGFEDLPWIWITPTLEAAFRHLATVEYEMRDDIDRYQRENLTPTDIAVRIRTHPALRVTAVLGAAQPTYVSFTGRRLQTRYFSINGVGWLEDNLRAGIRLLREAARHGDYDPTAGRTGSKADIQLYRNVPVSSVRAFLSEYNVHPKSPDLDRDMMIKYIDTQLGSDAPALQLWPVAVVGGDEEPVDLEVFEIGTIIRSQLARSEPDVADIKTLMSRRDRGIDLGLSDVDALNATESQLVRMRNDDPVHRNADCSFSIRSTRGASPRTNVGRPRGRNRPVRLSTPPPPFSGWASCSPVTRREEPTAYHAPGGRFDGRRTGRHRRSARHGYRGFPGR